MTGLSRYNVTYWALSPTENTLLCLQEERNVAIDVGRARHETPGCQAVLHFNNAGAALMPQPVLHAVVGHVQREALLGGYEAAEQAHAAVEHVYDAAATLLGTGLVGLLGYGWWRRRWGVRVDRAVAWE